MFRIDWSLVATDALLAEIRGITGSQKLPSDDDLRGLLTQIFRHGGGLPFTEVNWNIAHRTDVGRRLTHEAVGAALRRAYGRRRPLPGYRLSNVEHSAGLNTRIDPLPRVDLNSASVADLEGLPVFGQVLAARTIAERVTHGPFDSFDNLSARIKGIGDEGAKALEPLLTIRSGLGAVAAKHAQVFSGDDFAADLTLALTLLGAGEPADRLQGTLEALALFVASNPHPSTVALRRRTELDLPTRPNAPAPEYDVELIEDRAYLERILTLIRSAQSRIEVAMFFIAISDNEHPTVRLLDELIAARKRGAVVRVLVDRDREDDVYGSRIINSRAVEYLGRGGVEIRMDREDTLLHTKFIAIDKSLAVIGSHNWTRGSLEKYGDVSCVVHSASHAAALHTRFDQLWRSTQGN